MKTKEEKSQKNNKISIFNKSSFLKTNWALLVLLCLAFIVILILLYVIISPYLNKKSLENDLANMQTTPAFSVEKVVCYSNAYAINNTDSQGRWNLNLNQFTDIAIYLNSELNISSMYVDNISFSNSEIGTLSLSYLNPNNFGKSPIYNQLIDSDKLDSTANSVNVNNESDNISNNTFIGDITNDISNTIVQNEEKIILDLVSPITLRYLNQNLKENCIINDIQNPIFLDGSILKRGKVILSSLKNIVSFNLHITDTTNQEYTYPISIPITLENKETGKSIYDGSYLEENF